MKNKMFVLLIFTITLDVITVQVTIFKMLLKILKTLSNPFQIMLVD